MSLPVREAVFGLTVAETYDEWAAQPQVIRMCRDHYRKTRRRDGYTFGYRLRDGKIRAFVKEEHF